MSGSLAFVTGVGTPIITKSACLIIDGSVVASILLPGVTFQFINGLLVSPVPESFSGAGKMLRQGGGLHNRDKTIQTVVDGQGSRDRLTPHADYHGASLSPSIISQLHEGAGAGLLKRGASMPGDI